jgi:hypothetical protein
MRNLCGWMLTCVEEGFFFSSSSKSFCWQTQVDKLTRENQVSEGQLDELRKVCESLKQELIFLDGEERNTKHRTMNPKPKQFSNFAMGKNRVGTFNSTPVGSPAPVRRPSEPTLEPMTQSPSRTMPSFQVPPSNPPKVKRMIVCVFFSVFFVTVWK